MPNLSFPARRLLVLYRTFYGDDYPSAAAGNQNAHVKTQKMFYLLRLFGVNVGDYGFVWDQYGPYCETIQELVHELDARTTDVAIFYDNYPAGTASDTKFFADKTDPDSLFGAKELNRIQEARRVFEINIDDPHVDEFGDTIMRRWTELLGSIAYISQSMLPGVGKKELVGKLLQLKEKYNEAPEIENALKILEKSGMLTCTRT